MQSNKALIQKQIVNLECDSDLNAKEVASMFQVFVKKEINVIIEEELDVLGIHDDVEIPSLILDLGEISIDDDLNEVKQKVREDIREGLKDIKDLIKNLMPSYRQEQSQHDIESHGKYPEAPISISLILKKLVRLNVPLDQWYPKLMDELEVLPDDIYKRVYDVINDFMRLELNEVLQSKPDGLSSSDIYRRLMHTLDQQYPGFQESIVDTFSNVTPLSSEEKTVDQYNDQKSAGLNAEDLPTANYLQRTRLVMFILDAVLENLNNPQLFTKECVAKYESTFGHRLDEKYIDWLGEFEREYGHTLDMLRGNVNHLKTILSEDKEEKQDRNRNRFDPTLILGEDMLQKEGSLEYEWKQKIRNDVALQMQKLIVVMREQSLSLSKENSDQWSSLCSSAYTRQFKETLKEWILNRVFKFQQYVKSNISFVENEDYSEVLIEFLQESYHESFSNSYLPLKLLEGIEEELSNKQSTDGYFELDETSAENTSNKLILNPGSNVTDASENVIENHKKIRVQIRRVLELLASEKDSRVLNVQDSGWKDLVQDIYQTYYNEQISSWLDEQLDSFRNEFVKQNKTKDQTSFLIKHFLEHQYKSDVVNAIETVDYLRTTVGNKQSSADTENREKVYSSKSEIKSIIKKRIPLIVEKLSKNEELLTNKNQFVSVVMKQLDGLVEAEDKEYIAKRVERYFNLQIRHYFLNTADESKPGKPKLANVYLETLNTDFTDQQTSIPDKQKQTSHIENPEGEEDDVEEFSEQILGDLLDVVELLNGKESLESDQESNIEPLFKTIPSGEEGNILSLHTDQNYDVDSQVDKIYWPDSEASTLSDNVSWSESDVPKLTNRDHVSDEISQIRTNLLTFIKHISKVIKKYLSQTNKKYDATAWQSILEKLLGIEQGTAEEKVFDEIISNFKSAYFQNKVDYDKVDSTTDVLYLLDLYLTHNTKVYSSKTEDINSSELENSEAKENVQRTAKSLKQNNSESKRILMVIVERLSNRNIAVSKWLEVLKTEYQRSTQHSIPVDLQDDIQIFIRHVLPDVKFNPLQNNESNGIFKRLYSFLKGSDAENKKQEVTNSVSPEQLSLHSKVISSGRKKVHSDASGVAEDLMPVYNMGLVILWPYLGRFLKKLGYVEDNEFISHKHQRQSVLLLHYLATGRVNFDDAELFLPKVLCEIDPKVSLTEEYLELESSMEIACEELLFSCIKNWTALKTHSISFFRNGFMKRNGLAKMLHIGWQIEVERMNWDVLLSRLPWTIGIVKLPWMKKPVSVTWNPF